MAFACPCWDCPESCRCPCHDVEIDPATVVVDMEGGEVVGMSGQVVCHHIFYGMPPTCGCGKIAKGWEQRSSIGRREATRSERPGSTPAPSSQGPPDAAHLASKLLANYQ